MQLKDILKEKRRGEITHVRTQTLIQLPNLLKKKKAVEKSVAVESEISETGKT